ncbi:hypothetical protein SAMN04487906_3309 [Zhouia amylolytica]|uniref:Uncharacterized protein n=1 Tax=Zhouia amylolytica TaxID=376730 RepID=A0A1I6VRN0_9FLAO|nr:hypothetical protein SAMN04487906_3309 [Zhouia amylolytica]
MRTNIVKSYFVNNSLKFIYDSSLYITPYIINFTNITELKLFEISEI